MSFIQNFFTSRDNNANAATNVGQVGRLWYDPVTNAIYVSDGNTAGGILVSGGGGGNGTPALPLNSLQFNNAGAFGGNINLTYDAANSVLALTGLANITGNVTATDSITAGNSVSANVIAAENGLFINANVVTQSYTIPPGYNAMSAGPVTVPPGVVVDSLNGNWVIV
jgi:hypothetical protein